MQKKLDDLWEESRNVRLEINPMKSEKITVNRIINRVLGLNGQDIKRLSDFCYLGSVVAEDNRVSTDDNVLIQKASGSFCTLRKVWLTAAIQNETKIKIFNACVQSVLLYGCEARLVTS
jgi:hypothetical protein